MTPEGAAAAPEYLTPAEAAGHIRRSVKAFYRMLAADPTIPRTRLPGGGIIISRVAFTRWLRDRSEGVRTPAAVRVLPRADEVVR